MNQSESTLTKFRQSDFFLNSGDDDSRTVDVKGRTGRAAVRWRVGRRRVRM